MKLIDNQYEIILKILRNVDKLKLINIKTILKYDYIETDILLKHVYQRDIAKIFINVYKILNNFIMFKIYYIPFLKIMYNSFAIII